MKLIKTDKNYKYYELNDRNQDDALYYDSEVVAIAKEDLKYETPCECLLEGYVLPCKCDYRASYITGFVEYEVIPESVVIIK